jgi:methylphosphotriester-DNA--protein-cysteine methyltransferase
LEYPTFDLAETFVSRLAGRGEIDRDARVAGLLRGQEPVMSIRSVQRHVLRATGLTVNTLRQIERARHAARLLQEGVSILDVVRRAGYYDQAHLTRSLKHRIGQTPTDLQRGRRQLSINLQIDPPLSFPYKTPSRR